MIYRITNSTIPLRAKASDRSEMVNQLLYGELVTLLRSSGSWMYARSISDGYEGWLAMEYEPIQDEEQSMVLVEREGYLDQGAKGVLKLSPGSLVTQKEKETLTMTAIDEANGNEIDNIIFNAKMFLNTPYLWGGRSLWGIDCSGLIQIIFSLSGLHIPRDAYQQAEFGDSVEFDDSQTGDVAFFENPNSRITHVGILIDHDHILHASGHVRIDGFDNQGILRKTDGKRTHKLNCVKRFTVAAH